MPFVELHIPIGLGGACWRYAGGHVRPRAPHRHAELEANLTVTGHAKYLMGEQAVPLPPNSLVWLFPDQDHLLVDASPDFDMWILLFRPGFLDHQRTPLPRTAEGAPHATEVRLLPQPVSTDLADLARSVRAFESEPALFDAGLAWWLLRAWHSYRVGEAAPATKVHGAVGRAVSLLRQDPGLDLPSLARSAGLSPSRLSRLFKAEMGVSVTQLRNRIRLDRVDAAMAAPTAVPLLTAALAAGFGSYAQFFRVFRGVRQTSPARYYDRHGG